MKVSCRKAVLVYVGGYSEEQWTQRCQTQLVKLRVIYYLLQW